jgi:hypothetical protein
MRLWLLPFSIVLAVLASLWLYTRTSDEGSPSEDPMVWASDHWVLWQRWPGGFGLDGTSLGWAPEALDRFAQQDGLASPGKRWSVFESAEGAQVWHAEERWERLPAGWNQQSWRGGFLAGTPTALELWNESPGSMAKHWRDAEQGASLRRTDVGWEWWGGGWIVWPGHAPSSAIEGWRLWRPSPKEDAGDMWIGRLHEAPSSWCMPSVEDSLRKHGIPLSDWGIRWSSGGRWHVGDSAVWNAPLQTLCEEEGWGVSMVGEDVVVDASRVDSELAAWEWLEASRERSAWIDQNHWQGSLSTNHCVVWHVNQPSAEVPNEGSSEGSSAALGTAEKVTWEGSSRADLGYVSNHLTGGQLRIVQTAQGVGAFDDSGQRVWEVASDEVLPAGAVQVDVYRNGKFQTAFSTRDGFHLVDVKGREVAGFPIAPASGDAWTSMAVVDYEANANHRFLLASEESGKIQNFRGEGEVTSGWSHQPAPGIDMSSPVRHIEHLRLGSRDYIYVGRDNGQVELLHRNGETRAQTPVQVNPAQPPKFRKGRDLDGTSVLFIDALGWVREFTLGQGNAVGLSGMTRADHLDMMDLDGDGLDEVVTWLRGERTVWNARNEPIE